MGSSKMNTITDPLEAQKTQAANIGLGNYQTASNAVPGLSQYYNSNFGQSPMATLGNLDPLSQAVYKSVEGDVTGTGGPFASLKQNLLGSFDTGQTQSNKTLEQQLQAQGLLGSGAGMAVLGQAGTNAAQQRALLGSQVDVNELNMANMLGQQLLQQNQQQGFQDPMMALQQIQSLSQTPQFQSPETTYYTPGNKFQTTADILGLLGGQVVGQGIGNVIAPKSSAPPITPGLTPYGSPGSNLYAGAPPQLGNASTLGSNQMSPQMLAQLVATLSAGGA